MWQDFVMAGVSVGMSVALVPAVLSRADKPPLATSINTAVLLLVTTLVELTLSLWVASAICFVTSILWVILAAQKLRARAAK